MALRRSLVRKRCGPKRLRLCRKGRLRNLRKQQIGIKRDKGARYRPRPHLELAGCRTQVARLRRDWRPSVSAHNAQGNGVVQAAWAVLQM
jgi:hypothetical protein